MKNWYSSLKIRYATFPAEVQILNMVSDLKKAANLYRDNKTSSVNHLYRAIILLDYIVEDKKWRNKLKELLRLREVIGSFIFNEHPLANFDQAITAALLLEPKAYKTLKRN